MRDLSTARDGWEERFDMETRLLRRLTIFESVAQLESLYREFRVELERAEPLVRAERAAALAELQERLGRLGR